MTPLAEMPPPYMFPSFGSDFSSGLNLTQPPVFASNFSGVAGELLKILGLGALATQDKMLSRLKLTREQLKLIDELSGGALRKNVYFRAAQGTKVVGKTGTGLAGAGKLLGILGIGISTIDGVNTQRNQDQRRGDLSDNQKTARWVTRGAASGAGAYGGAKAGAFAGRWLGRAAGGALGAFCGPAAVGCSAVLGIGGGFLGGAAGGAVGGWLAREWFGG